MGATGASCLSVLASFLLQSIQYDLADRERAVAVVGAFHYDPRRPRCVGNPQKMTRHFLQLVVGFKPIPVPLGHPPSGVRVAFQRLQTVFLPLFGQVKPEFQHQRSLAHQHRLKAVDPVGLGIQLF
jgi:hypothetical protein